MRSAGTETRRRRSVLTAALIAVALLAIGAVAWLQGTPEFHPMPALGGDAAPVEQTPQPEPSEQPLIEHSDGGNRWVAIIAIALVSLVGAVVLFVIIRSLIRALRQWWAERPLRATGGVIPAAGLGAAAPEEAVQAPVVRNALAAALDEVSSRADPSDAIVAAWVGFEAGAEDAGLRRGTAETPGEFTVRIVGSRPAAADDVRALLRLYEGVRFGGHVADERDRGQARGLLERIEEHWR